VSAAAAPNQGHCRASRASIAKTTQAAGYLKPHATCIGSTKFHVLNGRMQAINKCQDFHPRFIAAGRCPPFPMRLSIDVSATPFSAITAMAVCIKCARVR
jgi:hypothetical protein